MWGEDKHSIVHKTDFPEVMLPAPASNVPERTSVSF